MIIMNIWPMNRNETYYKDPGRFWPERFEGERGTEVLDLRAFVFGFGGRACAGFNSADSVLLIFIAYVLATFEISSCVMKVGKGLIAR